MQELPIQEAGLTTSGRSLTCFLILLSRLLSVGAPNETFLLPKFSLWEPVIYIEIAFKK